MNHILYGLVIYSIRQYDSREPHFCCLNEVKSVSVGSDASDVFSFAMNPIRSEIIAIGSDTYIRLVDRRFILRKSEQEYTTLFCPVYMPRNEDCYGYLDFF